MWQISILWQLYFLKKNMIFDIKLVFVHAFVVEGKTFFIPSNNVHCIIEFGCLLKTTAGILIKSGLEGGGGRTCQIWTDSFKHEKNGQN